MASISKDGRVQFFDRAGARKTIRLGKIAKKQRESFRVRVEQLASSLISGFAPDDETTRWVSALADALHEKLSAVGLVPARQSSALGPWLDCYCSEKSTLKPRTRTSLRLAKDRLIETFGAARDMRTITKDEASQWRAKMLEDGSAEATVNLHCAKARQFFAEAAERGLIKKSVFKHLPSGAVASKNERYVTPADAAKVLSALDDDIACRTVFALARDAGLRVPSETHLLRWIDVDFDKGRMNVRSPKTAHHEGHDKRIVPVTPRLMKSLQKAFDAAPDGEENVIYGPRSSARIFEVVQDAMNRSEVQPWDDLFRTLRSSCEKEWAMTLPQFAVSKWMGHSMTVSGKHYGNHVPDEVLERVSQKAAQQGSESLVVASQAKEGLDPETPENPDDFKDLQECADGCGNPARTVGFRPSSHRF